MEKISKTAPISGCFVRVLLVVVMATTLGSVAGTVYTVGGTSGWDISTDINSWAQDKNFLVGDSLWFQFSSYESVAELTRKDFDSCNTTNPIMINKSGNATVPLTRPAGDRFFTSGNSLYCGSGLKLQVHVVDPNQTATTGSPVAAPAAGPALPLPSGSSKNNNPVSSSFGTRLLSDGRNGSLIIWFLIGLFWCA